jgi:hypothetical protein
LGSAETRLAASAAGQYRKGFGEENLTDLTVEEKLT